MRSPTASVSGGSCGGGERSHFLYGFVPASSEGLPLEGTVGDCWPRLPGPAGPLWMLQAFYAARGSTRIFGVRFLGRSIPTCCGILAMPALELSVCLSDDVSVRSLTVGSSGGVVWGRWEMALRTVGRRCSLRKQDIDRLIAPSREASRTSRFLVCGTPKSAHSMTLCHVLYPESDCTNLVKTG